MSRNCLEWEFKFLAVSRTLSKYLVGLARHMWHRIIKSYLNQYLSIEIRVYLYAQPCGNVDYDTNPPKWIGISMAKGFYPLTFWFFRLIARNRRKVLHLLAHFSFLESTGLMNSPSKCFNPHKYLYWVIYLFRRNSCRVPRHGATLVHFIKRSL